MIWGVTGPRQLEGNGGAVLSAAVEDWMQQLPYLDPNVDRILNGYAEGIDRLVDNLCDIHGYKKQRFPVTKEDWRAKGKAAGHIRNGEMVRTADTYVGFWNGKSRGTKNCIEQALDAGKLAMVYFSSGVIWLSDYDWSPLDYGNRIDFNRSDIAAVLSNRLKLNTAAMRRDDGSLDWERVDFADNRAWDAATWLKDGNIIKREWSNSEHLGEAVFESKSRAKERKKHWTSIKGCTCEGWQYQGRKAPCIHMFIVWMNDQRLKLIEKELSYATVTE